MVSPVREAGRTLFIHGSPAPGIGVKVPPSAGRGGNVAVDAGVFVAVGGSVAVGMAA